MRIFVIGYSQAGKSTFATRVCGTLGLPHVQASAWVREACGPDTSRAVFASYATERLRADPTLSATRLRAALRSSCVVEGVRNPADFAATFDPRCDTVVCLERVGVSPADAFDEGVDAIWHHVEWLVRVGLLPPHRAMLCVWDDDASFEMGVASVASLHATPPDSTPHLVHAPVPPLTVFVAAEYLCGGGREGEFVPGEAFALSSYRDAPPTFQVLLEGGAVFSDLPVHALVSRADADRTLEPRDLCYEECRSAEVTVATWERLAGEVRCYFRYADAWMPGWYVLTADWYTTNEQLHLVALQNGQFALLPNHKVLFGQGGQHLPAYRKRRVPTPAEHRPLVLATRNPGKIREMREMLRGAPFVVLPCPDDVPEVEEDADTLVGNAEKKARAVHMATGCATLADDTGLFVDALGGAPGVRSARYAGEPANDAANRAKLLDALSAAPHPSARRARFRTVLAFVDEHGVLRTFEGVCEGHVAPEERGTRGFGYDALFVPDDQPDPEAPARTFAELTPEEKNRISHRARALHTLLSYLTSSS